VNRLKALFIEKAEGQLKAGSSNSGKSPSQTASPKAPPLRRECGNSAKVMLEVIAGPHKGAKFEFDRHDTLLVGRAEVAHLRLQDDHHFSRHHFRMEIHPPECYLVDLDSRNGTFVNGERVREKFLKDGDMVSGGKTKIRVSVLYSQEEVDWNAATFIAREGECAADFDEPKRSKIDKPHHLQCLAGYEIVEELGKGGRGIVYRAIQKSTAKPVALKLIIPEKSVTEEDMQLFIREASILSQLNHPYIVQFYEFGMAAGQLFLAMEYVKTVDLDSIFKEETRKSRIRISCAIVCKILNALSYAHSRSLVHRDLKPANIFITRERRKLSVKLADFGLSKNYLNAGFSGITQEGQTSGTLPYMSPEQIVNFRHAKPASDIYAIGATLYQYFSGEYPHDFSTGRSQLAVILEDDPIPLDHRCPDLPAELVAIVHRALAKKPAERLSSAEEMRQALLPFSKRRRS
jgi:serine/threonine-protein kinase